MPECANGFELFSIIVKSLTWYLVCKGDIDKICPKTTDPQTIAFYAKLQANYFSDIQSQSQNVYLEYKRNIGKSLGIILQKTVSDPEPIFAKKINVAEFADIPCLKLAFQTGLKTPCVDWIVGENIYQLSRSLSREEKKGKYQYADLSKFTLDLNYYIDLKQAQLHFKRKPDGSFSDFIEIDKQSIARFLIGVVWFGLSDTHIFNIGIITSRKMRGGSLRTKSKLGLIDFQLHPEAQHKMESKEENESLKEYIVRHIKKCAREEDLPSLLAWMESISEQELKKALTKMKKRFIENKSVCLSTLNLLDVLYSKLLAMDGSLFRSEPDDYNPVTNIKERWLCNFEKLREASFSKKRKRQAIDSTLILHDKEGEKHGNYLLRKRKFARVDD